VSDPGKPDNLELVRARWAKEKAGGFWDEAYLERQRQNRRKWIEEQLALRAENARAQE
jgi:hypothetical protein